MTIPHGFDPPFNLERVRGKTVLTWRGKGLEIVNRDLDHEKLRAEVHAALVHEAGGRHDLIRHLRADRHDPARRMVSAPATRLLEIPSGTSAEDRKRMTLDFLEAQTSLAVVMEGDAVELA